jgi:dTDP-glucose pyrophosphorylase
LTPTQKPTLLVLAAGIGSRYGGIKQIDGFGPGGETIMDYSLYDAWRSGFGKVVFVVREEILETVRDIFLPRLAGRIQAEFVVQSLDKLIPEAFRNPERKKPWGTGHAVLCARHAVSEPFVVINADDFYGRGAFESIAGFFSDNQSDQVHAMVGYRLASVLSDFGTVSRGVGETDGNGFLTTLVERTAIARDGDSIFYTENSSRTTLSPDAPISMNFWGFYPSVFELASKLFVEFLQKSGGDARSEFYIPIIVNEMIQRQQGKVKVLGGGSTWFGVTYQEDRPLVTARIRELVTSGEYPSSLWGR